MIQSATDFSDMTIPSILRPDGGYCQSAWRRSLPVQTPRVLRTSRQPPPKMDRSSGALGVTVSARRRYLGTCTSRLATATPASPLPTQTRRRGIKSPASHERMVQASLCRRAVSGFRSIHYSSRPILRARPEPRMQDVDDEHEVLDVGALLIRDAGAGVAQN